MKKKSFDADNASFSIVRTSKPTFSARELGDLARGVEIIDEIRCYCHPHSKRVKRYSYMKINSRTISVGCEY